MPAPHAFYSKTLAERTASRNVLVLFNFIYLISLSGKPVRGLKCRRKMQKTASPHGHPQYSTTTDGTILSTVFERSETHVYFAP